ncbi:unnamed protein product (mitochondrion) [Plasmodiophora brassicae]|uniref:Uncharacterized protein n=1 Tax=Plasmodiophora brassicae TaxID=37360 RepID=A0A3P3YA17_PLABS|nr:unnamed protein product [Plasmodiophora brassicae]
MVMHSSTMGADTATSSTDNDSKYDPRRAKIASAHDVERGRPPVCMPTSVVPPNGLSKYGMSTSTSSKPALIRHIASRATQSTNIGVFWFPLPRRPVTSGSSFCHLTAGNVPKSDSKYPIGEHVCADDNRGQ